MRRHLAVDFLQLVLQLGNLVLHDSAVDFDLGFTHTSTGSHTASLPLQVRPHTGKTRQHVVVSSQFHLHLGIRSLCPLSEYFQNQTGPVYYAAGLYDLLYVSLLNTGQFIIENHILDFILFSISGYFFQFSAPDVCGIVRFVYSLDEFTVTCSPCSLCKELKFIKVFHDLPFVVILFYDSDENGLFNFYVLRHIPYRPSCFEKRPSGSGRPFVIVMIRLKSFFSN